MLVNEAYLFVQMSIGKNHHFKISLLDCVTSVTRWTLKINTTGAIAATVKPIGSIRLRPQRFANLLITGTNADMGGVRDANSASNTPCKTLSSSINKIRIAQALNIYFKYFKYDDKAIRLG
ncbi:MAG: hypothetical protein V7L04_05160 [Nostoc sp.]|uniref:hypothetical protein n=1 Tax=Nostoc sp. TaxID=1180 RepID=UPI002A5D98A2|nr:hypothetical protein [Nostoc sp. S13]